jgi:hypothetical protein
MLPLRKKTAYFHVLFVLDINPYTMAYLSRGEGFEDLKPHEIIEILKWALPNSFSTSFLYYIDGAKIKLSNHKKDLTIEIDVSEFRLNDQETWSKWISSYPLNAENFNGPEEPARGFLLTVLTQHLIEQVEILDDGGLIFQFEKGYEVKFDGDDDPLCDHSWSIEIFDARKGIKIAGIMCTGNVIYGDAFDGLAHMMAKDVRNP